MKLLWVFVVVLLISPFSHAKKLSQQKGRAVASKTQKGSVYLEETVVDGSAYLAEKWSDCRTGVTCYLMGTGSPNARVSISCVKTGEPWKCPE